MPPGSANGSKSRGNVDTVAVDVVALNDHITKIDSDPQYSLRLAQEFIRQSVVVRCTERTQFTASITLPNSTMVPPPISLNNAAVMGRDRRIENSLPVLLEGRQCARFVGPHQPRITDHVGRKDSRELTVDAIFRHRCAQSQPD